MPSYEQIGKRYCPKCKEERNAKTCPECGTKTKSNGKWSVRFRIIENGQEVNKRLSGFARRTDAQDAYTEFMSTYEKPIDGDDTYIKFKDLYSAYCTYTINRMKESTYITFKTIATKYILPHFAEYRIKDITEKNISEWQTEILKHNYSYKYNSLMHTVFVHILNYAVKIYGLQKNVAAKVGDFVNVAGKKEMLFWSKEEFDIFLSVIQDLYDKTIFSFFYYTGCRKGEIYALTWNEIDFNNRSVAIKKTLSRKVENASYAITSPKTKASYRTVFLPDNLFDLLQQLKEANSSHDDQFNNSYYVFGSTEPAPDESIRRRKNNYCKLAGVKEIRLHDFRHSNAALLISLNADIMTLSRHLGHASAKETLDTYGHMYPNAQIQLVQKINNFCKSTTI